MTKLTLDWVRKFGRLDVTKNDIKEYNKKIVKYSKIEDFEPHKINKINKIVEYLVEKYDPEFILLAKSQVDGYVIDEKSTQKDIELRQKLTSATKVSDWDVVVPGIKGSKRLDSMIVIDIYPEHWNNVKTIKIYQKE